jgi:hypothetical protein
MIGEWTINMNLDKKNDETKAKEEGGKKRHQHQKPTQRKQKQKNKKTISHSINFFIQPFTFSFPSFSLVFFFYLFLNTTPPT